MLNGSCTFFTLLPLERCCALKSAPLARSADFSPQQPSNAQRLLYVLYPLSTRTLLRTKVRAPPSLTGCDPPEISLERRGTVAHGWNVANEDHAFDISPRWRNLPVARAGGRLRNSFSSRRRLTIQ